MAATATIEEADAPTTVPNFTRLPASVAKTPADYPLNGLDEEQKQMVAEFKLRKSEVFAELTGEPLPGEQEWADDACLVRYLRATKWDLEHSVKRLVATLQWRREFRPTEILPEEIEEEALTGKEFYTGFDKDGRPLLFLVPANENTKTYDRQLRFVVYNLEKGIALMPPGVGQFTIIIDYENMSMFNATPVSVSKKFLHIISNHYPERLGKAFMVNPSWYLWVFFKLLGPFLDPVTKSKIHFVNINKEEARQHKNEDAETSGTSGWAKDIRMHIDPDQLPVKYGGTFDYEYKFDTCE